jgi:adenylate cyclase class IV
MGYKNREIEMKFEVQPGSELPYKLEAVARRVQRLCSYQTTDTVIGTSPDEFWRPIKGMKVDFARLRTHPNGKCQVTVKFADRGSNVNRVEIDMEVKDPKTGRAFLTQMLGPAAKKVVKTYFVYFFGNKDTNISVYQVKGYRTLYIEAEAKTEKRMLTMVSLLNELPWNIKREYRSLYQIHVRDGGRNIAEYERRRVRKSPTRRTKRIRSPR